MLVWGGTATVVSHPRPLRWNSRSQVLPILFFRSGRSDVLDIGRFETIIHIASFFGSNGLLYCRSSSFEKIPYFPPTTALRDEALCARGGPLERIEYLEGKQSIEEDKESFSRLLLILTAKVIYSMPRHRERVFRCKG